MKHTRILLLIALLGAAAVGLPSLRGATITVTEVGDGYNVHTNLRQALADANDGDTIEFDPSIAGRDLPLAPAFGQLVVNKSVTIRWVPTDGYPSYLGVNAWQQASRVFYISPGKTVIISGLSIRGGVAPDPTYSGGGIYNDYADLTLTNCTISGNSADRSVGGGVYNHHGTLTVSNCTISGNSAWYGGGIATNWVGQGTATVTIDNSTVSGNSAIVMGGGILNGDGATLTVTHSTLSGNSTSHDGGGIFNGNATLRIGNTIFNAGSGPNIFSGPYGTVTSLGYNLSSDNGGGYLTGTGDQINTDPRLGPLQDNGGPTFTHLPASDSLALDAGDPTLGMDQRGPGFQRVVNGRIDIGAAEVQAAPSPTPTPTPTPRPHGHR